MYTAMGTDVQRMITSVSTLDFRHSNSVSILMTLECNFASDVKINVASVWQRDQCLLHIGQLQVKKYKQKL